MTTIQELARKYLTESLDSLKANGRLEGMTITPRQAEKLLTDFAIWASVVEPQPHTVYCQELAVQTILDIEGGLAEIRQER